MHLIYTYGPLIVATPILALIADLDRRTQRIPDVLSLAVLALTAIAMTLLVIDNGSNRDLGSAALGAAMLTSILGVLHAVRPDGLGMGDVKLALTLGLLLGWTRPSVIDVALLVAWCLMISSAIGIVGVAVAMRRRGLAARGMTVPFGPSLCTGAFVVTVFGPGLIST